MKPVRIAVIGTGLIGTEHLRFIGELQSTELVGIADVSAAGAAHAQRLRVPYFNDFQTMLEAIRPEAAIVALPNSLHTPAVLDCVRLGIPTLVEKPIADTLPAATQLVDASEAAGVPVLVGHQRRHSPDIREARNALQQGKLGELIAVNGIWFVRKHDSYFDAEWRREHGGGPFLINLIHDIDCFRFMCGEIESVQAISSNKVRGFPVEDTAAILIRFHNGALGTMMMSDAVPSPWAWDMASGQAPYFPRTHADCYYIGGSKASLSVPTMELWRHKDGGDWRDPLTHERIPTGYSSCYINQLKHLVDIVRNGAKAICDARDAMMSLAVTLAIRTAAQEQRCVSISELLSL
ncbi:MAG: Gfo/Idh/MocA family oxidoreductase [Steroidobacteraceae bacterium]|jgi:predicted dehydrogenase